MRLVAALLLVTGAGQAFAAEPPKTETAIFAGGCFWCTEADFEKVTGVISAVSGYVGGEEKDATYDRVSSGRTGHAEAVAITYDPAKVTYSELVEHFWVTIDPTVENRQFCDSGPQYRTGIFYLNEEQKKIAEASKAALEKSNRLKGAPIHTEVTKAGTFYPAEEYHQDYYKKNSIRYNFYRSGCGRDRRLEQLWGKDAATH